VSPRDSSPPSTQSLRLPAFPSRKTLARSEHAAAPRLLRVSVPAVPACGKASSSLNISHTHCKTPKEGTHKKEQKGLQNALAQLPTSYYNTSVYIFLLLFRNTSYVSIILYLADSAKRTAPTKEYLLPTQCSLYLLLFLRSGVLLILVFTWCLEMGLDRAFSVADGGNAILASVVHSAGRTGPDRIGRGTCTFIAGSERTPMS
jgi:hypothetical protein